ncbi:MAG: DUF6569 family protein [Bacteroidota bacterium]
MKKFIAFIFLVFSANVFAQLTYPNLLVEYDSAIQYKNLKIIPIRKRTDPGFGNDTSFNTKISIIGLREALQQNKAKIKERGDHMLFDLKTLVVDNLSDKYLMLMAGEILAGGRQDRVIAKDILLSPKSQKNEIPVFCVEDGRWSDKEAKFKYQGGADNSLRSLMDSTMDQQKIWKFIRKQIRRNNINSETESYVNLIANKKLSDTLNEYYRYFNSRFSSKDSSYVGMVCMSGDKVIGSDIFITRDLFYSQLSFLLQGYISETLLYGGELTVSEKDITKYIEQLLTAKTQAAFVAKHGKMLKDNNGKVIHINTY